jgi:PAS domain S-box-containing protein
MIEYLTTPLDQTVALPHVPEVGAAGPSSPSLRTLAEALDEAVIHVSPDGTVTSWSRAAERLFGHGEQEAVGRPIYDLLPAVEHDGLVWVVQSIAQGSCREKLEGWRFGASRQGSALSLSALPIKHGDEGLEGAVLFIRDTTIAARLLEQLAIREQRYQTLALSISTLRNSQEELERRAAARTEELSQRNFELQAEIKERREAQEALARSNAELEHFAYIASHDLQEPLRMVSSYLQLLERRHKAELTSDAQEFIAYAVDGAARMKRLIQDLLLYSRVSTQGQPLMATDSTAAIADAAVNLEVLIREKAAAVTWDPLPTVAADASQLTQLFQNLLANALKFSAEAPPCVHVSAAPTDGGWRFCVQDNGIGIALEHAHKIFIIFQRLHPRDTYPGTGIGLAVCKKIVERHGGRIWVESALGEGARFYFTLPSTRGQNLRCDDSTTPPER